MFTRHLCEQFDEYIEEGCLIWEAAKFLLGIGMFGGDGLTRTVRFKFCRVDSLQNKTRTDEITTDMERRRFISYVRVSFSLNITSRKVDWAFQKQ